MSGGIQTVVNNQPAPAVAGDFASNNPNDYSVLAGPGGLVSGPSGVTVGRFQWAVPPDDGDGFPAVVNTFGSGPVTGFLAREQQGVISTFLAGSSMSVIPGTEITLYSGGDFWVKNDGAAEAIVGQKAYANFADGKVTFATTATPLAGASGSASTIAAGTSSVTGSILDEVLTVTAVGSGTLYPGTTISGSGVASGTKILSQSSGTVGGVGTYQVSIPEQNVASTAISGTYGLLTVGGTVVGGFGVGDVISGSGVTAGSKITTLGTGTGGAGTYIVDPTQTVGSTAISVSALNVETKWICMSSALPGELCKISSQPLG